MKVLQYLKPRDARIIESSRPRAHGRVSVAKTLYSSISAGTEMGFYRGTAPQFNGGFDDSLLFHEGNGRITYPMQSDAPGVWWMGYAAVGRIVEVAPDETDLKEGDLVFAASGHKEYTTSDEFIKLPSQTNPEHATLLSLMKIAFNSLLDSRIMFMDRVVIFGMGVIGQLLLQMCNQAGGEVICVDVISSRLQLAETLGASTVVNPAEVSNVGKFVQQYTSGKGADVVFEVSGNTQALSDAIRCAGYDGVVTIPSFYQNGADTPHLGREFHHKRITLRSSQVNGIDPALSRRYDDQRRTQNAISLLTRLNLAPLITHRVPFGDLPKGLAMIDKNPDQCLSVLVNYE